jgi:hypothetical protein
VSVQFLEYWPLNRALSVVGRLQTVCEDPVKDVDAGMERGVVGDDFPRDYDSYNKVGKNNNKAMNTVNNLQEYRWSGTGRDCNNRVMTWTHIHTG